MENSLRQPRFQRSESEIKALLKEKQTSQVSVKEFCERYDIHEATFYNWRKRYFPKPGKAEKFIPLEFNEMTSSSSLFAEIEIPEKAIVRLFQKVEPAYINILLRS